jgi:hypothetical protein
VSLTGHAHLPAAAIQVGDARCGQAELIGQEYQALVGLRIDVLDATERNGKPFVRIVTTQDHCLIADQTGRSIDGMGMAAVRFEIRFRACHEETARLVQPMQPLEVEVAAIHHVIGSRFWQEQIEHVDIVHLAVGNMDKAGDISAQIEQRVKFDGRFRRSKRCPGKHRQTQIDRRRIERVDRLGQVHAGGFLGIQAARDADQAFGEARVDARVARGVGIGQGVAGDVPPNPQVVKLRGLGSKARLDIPQTLPIRELREGHAQVLIEAREAFDLVLSGVARHASAPGGTSSAEDAASTAKKRAGLDASIDSAAGTADTVREGESMFKSRPRKYVDFCFIFIDLSAYAGSTLGHY